MLKPGDPAPAFSVQDHTGQRVELEGLRGKRVVLWFYPKADTPGCTKEGCGFRDYHSAYEEKGAVVLGVSYDDPATNAAFAEAYAFPFKLLSDVDKEVAKAYGAYDAGHDGYPSRSTYVIGADGNIEHVVEGVDPQSHPKELLERL